MQILIFLFIPRIPLLLLLALPSSAHIAFPDPDRYFAALKSGVLQIFRHGSVFHFSILTAKLDWRPQASVNHNGHAPLTANVVARWALDPGVIVHKLGWH